VTDTIAAPPAAAETAASEPSLWRNRDFNLLWSANALSLFGTSMSALAVPLLILFMTNSPVVAGAVGTGSALLRLLCQLPGGVLADRVNRRHTMLISDAVRLVAYAALGIGLLAHTATLTWIIITAVISALATIAYDSCENGALRNVVPLSQMAQAVARNEARGASVSLIAPPIGGVLYGIARSIPFLADALSYLLSFVCISLVRRPLQEERTEPAGHPVAELVEGIRFVTREPFLRSILLIAPPINLAFNGLGFAILLILQRHGTAPGVIGLAETIVGIGLLIGAFLAPTLAKRVPLRRLVLTVTWLGVALVASSALLTDSILMAVPFAAAILLGPACNAALFGYQAAITPDRLQGRVMSVIFMAAMSLSSLSAVIAGSLVAYVGGPATMLAFAGIMAVAAVAATVSRGVRGARPLAELAPAPEVV